MVLSRLFRKQTRPTIEAAIHDGVCPQHIAIIMDGNGRWAKRRLLPRVAGHRQGVETVRSTVRLCLELGVRHLTLFAFSSENWRRPVEEVTLLMQLFMKALEQEVGKLKDHGIRLRIVGDRSRFAPELQTMIAAAESQTGANDRLTLHVCANYGGRWDITQSINRLVEACPERAGEYVEQDLEPYLCFAGIPEPDLLSGRGKSASPTSCSGSWLIPSSTSPRFSGLISPRKSSSRPSVLFRNVNDVSGKRANRSSPRNVPD